MTIDFFVRNADIPPVRACWARQILMSHFIYQCRYKIRARKPGNMNSKARGLPSSRPVSCFLQRLSRVNGFQRRLNCDQATRFAEGFLQERVCLMEQG
jgi:hypothetical protein